VRLAVPTRSKTRITPTGELAAINNDAFRYFAFAGIAEIISSAQRYHHATDSRFCTGKHSFRHEIAFPWGSACAILATPWDRHWSCRRNPWRKAPKQSRMTKSLFLQASPSTYQHGNIHEVSPLYSAIWLSIKVDLEISPWLAQLHDLNEVMFHHWLFPQRRSTVLLIPNHSFPLWLAN